MSYRDPKTGRWTNAPFQPVTIFVYGTLKRGYRLNQVLRDCEFIGNATTERRYKMVCVGYPVVIPDEDGHPVVGELYRVYDEYTMKRLDSIEGAYDRKPVTVTMKNVGRADCMIYEGKSRYWQGAFSIGFGARSVLPNGNGVLDWQRGEIYETTP